MQDVAAPSSPAPATLRGDTVTRLVGAGARQTMAQLEASPAAAQGRICLIGLDAVRERMGGRWLGRREMVYEHLQAALRRRLGPRDLFLRLSEVEFLVAQPESSRLAGQACCLNVLREVLTYFLGSALTADIAVYEVERIEDGRIRAQALDPFTLEVEAARAPLARPPSALGGPTEPSLVSQDRWSPFIAHDGRRLRVSCQLEPVFQLKTYGRIGYRMTRQALQLPSETALSAAEEGKLTGADIERLDFATLARGLNRLQQQAESERQPSLMLPVSYATLSSHRGRAMLADFFRLAQGSVQRGLICEICDIDGIPPSALLAATSLIKPFCLFVIGRLGVAPQTPLAALKDVGLQGLTLDCPPSLVDDEPFAAFVEAVIKAARPSGVRAVMLNSVGTARLAAIAGLCGATHASFAPASPRPRALEVAPTA
jgi:hypothetical protein